MFRETNVTPEISCDTDHLEEGRASALLRGTHLVITWGCDSYVGKSLLGLLAFLLLSAAMFGQEPVAAAIGADEGTLSGGAVSEEKEESRWSREWLESKGVSLELGYRSELFSNLRGGVDGKRGANYLGSADTTVTFHLDTLGLGSGHFVVSAQSLHGRGINDRKVGAVQAASNLDDAKFNKFIEAYFTDTFAHERFTFKAGRLYADADFNVIENGGDFLNASYGLIPTVAMPTYPAPQLGLTLWTKVISRVSIGGGVYKGLAMEGADREAAPVSTGVFTILETKIEAYRATAALHGSYRVGVWQQAGSAWTANDPLRPVRNYGLYATGDHWFRKATSAGANVGPGVFFQVGWAPSNRNEIASYWGVGGAYPGVCSKRPDDSVGVGVTQARLATGKNETVTEIFYKVQATKRVFVQPDVQWVNRPAGDGRNALLGGVRVGVSF